MKMFIGGFLTALLSIFWFVSGAISGLYIGKSVICTPKPSKLSERRPAYHGTKSSYRDLY